MNWETGISKVTEEGAVVRGYKMSDLLGKISFTEMVCLLLKGELPKKDEREVVDAILVSAAEHGVQVPSVMAARLVQSAGNPVNAATAAGVLAIGDAHGGAGEQAAKLFQERKEDSPAEVVKEFLSAKRRLPGFGHKKYEKDPRVDPLFALAEERGLSGEHVAFAKAVDEELCKQSGKTLHLNVDGAMAAICSDLGFSWQSLRSLFIIARTVGVSAHVVEERASGKRYRREDEKNISYSGPGERKL